MENLLKFLMNNPYAWFILSFIAVLGFILSIVFAIKGRRIKKISFIKSTFNIIRNNKNELKDLEIKYKDSVIQSLAITKYSIWNSGNTSLEENDFASSAMFSIRGSSSAQILNASILKVSNEINKFSIDLDFDNNLIKIHFEYMDPNDGLSIQIIHTGSSDLLELNGKIKNGHEIKELNDKKKKARNNIFISIFIIIYFLLILLVFPKLKELYSIILYTLSIIIYAFINYSRRGKRAPKKIRV